MLLAVKMGFARGYGGGNRRGASTQGVHPGRREGSGRVLLGHSDSDSPQFFDAGGQIFSLQDPCSAVPLLGRAFLSSRLFEFPPSSAAKRSLER